MLITRPLKLYSYLGPSEDNLTTSLHRMRLSVINLCPSVIILNKGLSYLNPRQ